LQGLIVLECALGYFPFADPKAPIPKTAVVGNLSIFSLMEKISTGNPLEGMKYLSYSPAFKDFCTQCLMREANERPSSSALLEHPWVVASRKDKKTNLAKWMLVLRK
jgi:serine/threonine protein kinase